MRAIIVLAAVLVMLAGCGADDQAPPPIDEQTAANDQQEEPGNSQDGSDDDPENGQDGPEEGQEPVDASLEHTLRFSTIGPDGDFRLTLEPDGAAEGQRGRADPFDFEVEDEELATIAAAVDDADLANQPSEFIDPDVEDQVADSEPEDVFEYGNARVRVVSGPRPDELVELAELLTSLRSKAPGL